MMRIIIVSVLIMDLRLSLLATCILCGHAHAAPPTSVPSQSSTSSSPVDSNGAAEGTVGDVVIVTGKRAPATAARADVTGLGRTTKTADDIAKKQVQGIRDLTRYDPGIAVNEQGQGASAGYSIRGVDKDRVAIVVDGIAQGQSFGIEYGLFNGLRSGAKNEVEYENMRAVDLQEGASSVLAGSGALGGAVLLRTKEPEDLLDGNERWAIQAKGGYTSKNKGQVGSVGLAFRTDGAQGLLIHTRRRANELRSHADVEGQLMPRYICNPNTGCEQQSVWVGPEDVTGPTRALSNPMDISSESTLAKISVLPTDEHEVGTVAERTTQKYRMVDMGRNAYYRSNKEVGSSSERTPDSAQWTRYWFGHNDHDKMRAGVFYQYKARDPKESWLDALRVEADHERIDMTTIHGMKSCSKTLNLGCEPAHNGQSSLRLDNEFSSWTQRLNLQANKTLRGKSQVHNLQLDAGIDRGEALVTDRRRSRGVGFIGITDSLGPIGWYHLDQANPVFGNGASVESKAPIRSRHSFIALSDNAHFGEHWSASLGLRVDRHQFKSSTPSFQGKDMNYTVPSFLFGLTHHFNDAWQLGYKFSTGYRVPSVQQLYGASSFGKNEYKQTPLRHERATNHEIGLTWDKPVARLSASAFRSDYKDLISLFLAKRNEEIIYRNSQKASTWGYKLSADINLAELFAAAPNGLSTHLAYGQVRQRGKGDHPDDGENVLIANHVMDTIQPAKLVVGLQYAPENRPWTLGLMYTRSSAKRAEELTVKSKHPIHGIVETQSVDRITPAWSVVDLEGSYRWKKNTTLRFGIGNLFNKKYTTWESMRQTGLAGVSTGVGINNLSDAGYQRLTAPGRNWQISLETRF